MRRDGREGKKGGREEKRTETTVYRAEKEAREGRKRATRPHGVDTGGKGIGDRDRQSKVEENRAMWAVQQRKQ